jgi:hypothetical protein
VAPVVADDDACVSSVVGGTSRVDVLKAGGRYDTPEEVPAASLICAVAPSVVVMGPRGCIGGVDDGDDELLPL